MRPIEKVLYSIGEYRENDLDINSLKGRLLEGAALVSSNHVREILSAAEGRIDILEHTVDDHKLRPTVLKVLGKLEMQLKSVSSNSD